MSRRPTSSSEDIRDDLDFEQLTLENALARERARQGKQREEGRHRGLSQRLSEHEAPMSAGAGRTPNQSPIVTPRALQESLEAARVYAPAGVGLAPNVSSSSCSGVPDVEAILEAVTKLPSLQKTLRPNQRAVLERIWWGDVFAADIDDLLEEHDLDTNDLTVYIAARSLFPPPPPHREAQRRAGMDRILRGDLPRGEADRLMRQ